MNPSDTDGGPVIDGLRLDPLPTDTQSALLASLSGTGDRSWPAPGAAPVWWARIDQPNGYLVGRFQDGAWTLAGPDGHRVHGVDGPWDQIRVFQPGEEILLAHRTGRVRGVRRLRTPSPQSATSPHHRFLLVERSGAAAAPGAVFPVNRDAVTGLTAVIPEPRSGTSPLTMVVREHFTADPHSGAVRVAAVCWDRYSGGVSDPLLTEHAASLVPAAHGTAGTEQAPDSTRAPRRRWSLFGRKR
ncbi:hypothetical protein [Rhodococcus ruber]|uniref:hypothetical protein n=1 Tax=Rhodococcus ruber TaxID=1830 RepID=UPI000C7C2C40|nr:hypothetical protein [Rhodococcus ruber]AUM20268.1 hypothetical protein CSW53_27265 [Rhodococcus ruber]